MEDKLNIQINTKLNPPEINITIPKIKKCLTIKCSICSKLIWPWQTQFVNKIHLKCFLKKLEDIGFKLIKVTIDGIVIDHKKPKPPKPRIQSNTKNF